MNWVDARECHWGVNLAMIVLMLMTAWSYRVAGWWWLFASSWWLIGINGTYMIEKLWGVE